MCMSWTRVRNSISFHTSDTNFHIEHIKYPEASKVQAQAQVQQNGNPQQQNNLIRKTSGGSPAVQQGSPSVGVGQVYNNNRSMSPAAMGGSDTEDVRRAVSPPNARSMKPVNGVVTQPFPTGPTKGKPPVRQKREEDDGATTDEGGMENTPSDSGIRERAISPEQSMMGRAKSPQYTVASRAVSPNGVEAGGPATNIASVLNSSGRSSPAVDRSRPPPDAFSSSPSPQMNGHFRSGSRTGNGSIGNVTADLVRDLKSKEAEVEGLKRQMIWMREALGKASRAGFIYTDRDMGDIENGSSPDNELVLKFKQFRAQMQVWCIFFNIST